VFFPHLERGNVELVHPISTLLYDYFEALVGKFGTQFTTSQPHHMISLALVIIDSRREIR